MNRYGRGVGPSKATPSTTCQKCLKKDNYECKAIAQERPYVSRPSRTQQLLNPKLVPKLTSDVPQELLRKKGIANEQLARMELERGRKRDRENEDAEFPDAAKRMRSASSVSVSTISTSLSRSPSPQQRAKRSDSLEPISARLPETSSRDQSFPGRPTSLSPHRHRRALYSEKKRRRSSVSSLDSYSSENRRSFGRESRERRSSRSTRRKFQQASPPARGRKTESRSPNRERRRLSNNRQHMNGRVQPGASDEAFPQHHETRRNAGRPREKSLSPFSKRLALTQAMNMGT